MTTPPPAKPSKPKPQNPPPRSTGISSHFLMIELKQRILTSLNKLSDRDTHQIALEDLDKIIETLSPEGISMLLNTLYDTDYIQKPILRKESVRLLATLATVHSDSVSTHLTKIIAHIVKRLKDSDSGVRDSCQTTIGVLASQYLKASSDGENANLGSVVSLFVKPLFEALNEQNKTVQAGSAICLAKMIECATNPPVPAFQKLCMRVCKYLSNPNFLAKASLLSVVSSLAQVGAISPQSFPVILQCLHESLESSDWATRRAAADALNCLASHSSHLIVDGGAPTITAIEACRFDKVKPVRDSMTEALQAWKKISGKGEDGLSEDTKSMPQDGESQEVVKSVEKLDLEKSIHMERKPESSAKETSKVKSPSSESLTKVQNSSISDKTVGILKKKAPVLTDKELNPEFFQKLETRGSGDLPVEVVVPRRCLHSSHSQGEEESELNNGDSRVSMSNNNENPSSASNEIHGSTNVNHQNSERRPEFARDKWVEQRAFRGKDSKTRVIDSDGRFEFGQRDTPGARLVFSRSEGHSEGVFMNNKGNWLGIQRQLAQLERQQVNLMNMLQEFMGGSHDSMVTLENRVRGLERIVEDMARDLAVSSGRRGGNLMIGFDKFSPNVSNGRMPFAERFSSSDGISGVRGRDPPWRSDLSDAWDSYSYGTTRNGHLSARRAAGGSANDGRGTGTGNRQAWDKGQGPARLGEGPSARSVWQASKDEATLEAIRVAGEDSLTSRTATRVPISELNAEALGDDNPEQERDPLWAAWGHAMDSLHVGDVDSAYAEVLSAGDEQLLVKLMDRTGPVMDQLSNEIANEVLHAVGQFLLEQSLFDIGLSWTQQLTELVMENGMNFLGISFEGKRALLLSLHEASSAFEAPDDWEGATAEELLMRLAAAWGIDLHQLEK